MAVVEEKKEGVGLKLKLSKEEKPHDEFELSTENKPFVSKYEKEHPNVMPKILKQHMERKKSGITDKLLRGTPQPVVLTVTSAPVELLLGASLDEKLIKMEATLRPPAEIQRK